MLELTLQIQIENHYIPVQKQFEQWVTAAFSDYHKPTELTIRCVDEQEMQALNQQYRQQNKPTNVLSFPVDLPLEVINECHLLGDIVLCAPVVNQQAHEQQKISDAHWAHMVIHGVLHLLGYDHQTETESGLMESKEIAILKRLGFTNPYTLE